MKRISWGTRLGFYLASIGSAYGLGNLWRFPYVVAENGGGAFVLVYIFLAFIVGLPLLIGELMLGKSSGKSVVAAIWPFRRWRVLGVLPVILTVVVLSYYAVISGWVLHFSIRSIFWGGESYSPVHILQSLQHNAWLKILLTAVHLLVTVLVVAEGVEEGIERWISYMVPLFICLLIALSVQALMLPTAPQALRFLFYPDFSRLKAASLGQALGHVFFTLSIGFGSVVTFGSYMTEDYNVPISGFRVTVVDTLISLFAGIVIFPVVLASERPIGGPETLFLTLPQLFKDLEGGVWFGIVFFLCLYLAALSACIGLLESVVSNVMGLFKVSRPFAAWAAGCVAFIISVFPALGTSQGRSVLEIVDNILINWILPLSTLGICLIVGRHVSFADKEREFIQDPALSKLFSNWCFVMKWLAPTLISLAMMLQIFGLLHFR